MPGQETQVTITEGLPVNDPWVITDIDSNLKNLALARLAALGANQGAVLRVQTNVLVEQTGQLENMQEFTATLASGAATALVMDSSGKVLISDPNIVSDLVGRTPSSLTTFSADRLTAFTTSLASSSPAVNLGGRPYAELALTSGAKIQVPVVLWSDDPNSANSNSLEPYVYYLNKASDGTMKGVIYDVVNGSKVKLSVSSVNLISFPDKNLVYDGYKLTVNGVSKVFGVQNVIGSFPTTAASDTLFRDISTGTLRLVGPSSANITFTDAQGFVIPSCEDEIYYWFGQASADRLPKTNAQFSADEIKLPVSPDAIQWKFADSLNFSGGGIAHYPIAEGAPGNLSLPVGSLTKSDGKTYLITGKSTSSSTYAEVTLVGSPFVLKLTQDNVVNIRGQYTEKITKATQRTTEQQLFLNSLLQKQNYHFDAATNVLKALSDLNNKFASQI